MTRLTDEFLERRMIRSVEAHAAKSSVTSKHGDLTLHVANIDHNGTERTGIAVSPHCASHRRSVDDHDRRRVHIRRYGRMYAAEGISRNIRGEDTEHIRPRVVMNEVQSALSSSVEDRKDLGWMAAAARRHRLEDDFRLVVAPDIVPVRHLMTPDA